eukprot:CFRG3660T1
MATPVHLSHSSVDNHFDPGLVSEGSLVHVTARFRSWSQSPDLYSFSTAETAFLDKSASAYASFKSEYNTTGWDRMWITTSDRVPTQQAFFAAGYLEGMLTYESMYSTFVNMRTDWFEGGPIPVGLARWIKDNVDWTRLNAMDNATHWTQHERAFWAGVSNTMYQLDGLVQGYQDFTFPEQNLTDVQIYMLSADGDLETLVPMFTEAERKMNMKLTAEKNARKNDRCSALVKVLPDKSDIFFGHATWDHFQLMVRQLKTYNFKMQCSPYSVAARTCERYRKDITFSSTPGFLWSLDDFYLTSAGLFVMETSNTNFNETLSHSITHKSVPCWIRGSVANLLSESAEEWVKLFGIHNSGTYDSQWMVMNMNSFAKGENLPAKSFYVLEQLPGTIHYEDMSEHLNKNGYWASYNVPFFSDIYNTSGWAAKYEELGDEWSHERCPRANIFREQQLTVSDVQSMQRIMRYNDFENDPLSLGQPGNAIAGRWDLAKGEKFQLDGAIDAKITNVGMGRKLIFMAVNGPTTDQQPPFSWAPFANVTHAGQPSLFNFDWVMSEPRP